MSRSNSRKSRPGPPAVRHRAWAAAAAGRPPRGPRSQQWAARGFLAPVVIYLGAFYAYPHVHNDQEWNAIMATAVVASLPAAVILVLAQRYVAAGVTAGAVKD